ncbi:TPA: hypothetical protein ACIU9R_002190 [Salmonella enterica subsp. enterica serovar Birkenhead]|uniref:hypothetical protein n=1 Tax=Salmonella enterica TaxID=28901 RepID=UPI00107A9B4B|nr:hypothetical protein [Salmonella enterica]EAB6033249.1 hypothetical protein [Salmonella enterica subsp. enterica serovar Java]EBI0041159.1 hypothetical protein [Salmonella enterica subsp. diarizonae serovar 61:k:z35]ECD9254306.1 hypothetical protein [Salmonella enterica subsp. diarizonae]ECT8549830.1 hypothetical protein [Salmonella enterica subsp. diarizonae serovar 48:i:z]EIC4421519.1 hypothetical protein [Salmonella enterica subsp. enterica serovar Cerro]
MQFIYKWQNYSPVIWSVSVTAVQILNNSVKLFPFALMMFALMAFYFLPERIISDVVNSWMETDTSGKISLIKLYLEATFMLSLASSSLLFMYRGKRCAGK